MRVVVRKGPAKHSKIQKHCEGLKVFVAGLLQCVAACATNFLSFVVYGNNAVRPFQLGAGCSEGR